MVHTIILFLTVFSLLATPAEAQRSPGPSPAPLTVQKVQPIQPGQAAQRTAMLARLRALPTRASLINTLMTNPATRTQLETAARQAKLAASQLAAKSLDGRSMPVMNVIPAGQLSSCAVDWRAGVKFTPFAKYPSCFEPQTNYNWPLAIIEAEGIHTSCGSHEHLCLSDFAQLDVIALWALTNGPGVMLHVQLPREPATYVVTVHAIGTTSSAVADFGLEALRTTMIGNTALPLTPLSDSSGFVAFYNHTPSDFNVPFQAFVFHIKNMVGVTFGGITLMRL